jgi:hypothetical protein
MSPSNLKYKEGDEVSLEKDGLIQSLCPTVQSPSFKMHFLTSFSLLLAVPLASSAAIGSRSYPSKRALYFLDNNPSGASIVSLNIAANGIVSNPVRTHTGGVGLYALTASSGGTQASAAPRGMPDPRCLLRIALRVQLT